MAESSSDSDTFLRSQGRQRGFVRDAPLGSLGGGRASGTNDITEKIYTLADTLQDTNRNLRNVDQLLGQYRVRSSQQSDAMTSLKEDLEDSLNQLRNQRLNRNVGGRSASLSTLHTSDLDGTSAAESRRYQPTSPLRDYQDSAGSRRRRSRSASVRFVDEIDQPDQLHSLHQSLRDLSSDQLRLGDDIQREISWRNRRDVETKKTLEELSHRLGDSQRQETVSERVERRLQEIEREMRTERHLVDRRQEQLGQMSLQLQEAIKKRDGKLEEIDAVTRSRLLQSEREKSQIEQELERTRKRLDQSEGGRDVLHRQVDDLRARLLKMEQDRTDLQQRLSQVSSLQRSRHEDEEEERQARAAVYLKAVDTLQRRPESLAKSLLQEQCGQWMASTFGLLYRIVLTSDLEKREKQQLRMLEQLREIQAHCEDSDSEQRRTAQHVEGLVRQLKESGREADEYLAQAKRAEQLRAESEKKKEELRVKAQESIRQWKLRYRKMEQELEKQKEHTGPLLERSNQVSKEKESLQTQLLSAVHQMETLRSELSDALAKRAQREEDLHHKEAELEETRSQQRDLEREIREVQDAANKLEAEMQKQRSLQAQLSDENRRLEDEVSTLARRHELDREALLEMQGTVKDLSATRAELTRKVAEEEKSRKEAEKRVLELGAERDCAFEEVSVGGRQLKLEREVHQKELADLRAELQSSKSKQEKNLQEVLRHFKEEREELESRIGALKAELAESRNVARAQHSQAEKMKAERDRLTEQLTASEEENVKLRRKYQLLKQELEEKAVSQMPGLLKDPHRWLAETKTRLQWVCEEVKEREAQQRKLRRHLQQSREQLKGLALNKDSEQQLYLEQISKQEQLLEEIHKEKRDLLEKTRRKDEELRSLQDRIVDLETSTRVALDHLESVPEKLSLLEDFKDLEESQRQRNVIEEKYSKYKEILGTLQQQLEDSKHRMQEYRDLKMDANARSLRIESLSSTLRGQNSFLSSSLLPENSSPHRRQITPDLEANQNGTLSTTVNGTKSEAEKEQ
nr:PREDICTED: centrosomal protein of 128 kDa [Latimeria chalumnae]|eukprot:XP_014341972.1 PREDICTED: centrosomal protein of 128 kDa [Latimeria chalumnae]